MIIFIPITHDLRFKDLGRCLWLKLGDSKQHIHVPEMVLKTLQPTVCDLKGYQWYHNKSEGNSRQQKRHYTHHPLNFHFCHLFSYYHHKISSCSPPFPCIYYGQLFSYFQHLHFRHRPLFLFYCPTTFIGSTCKRNFSQDQHARGTSHRINMQEELLTWSTCKRNFSQDQHARGTSHRINMQEELLLG